MQFVSLVTGFNLLLLFQTLNLIIKGWLLHHFDNGELCFLSFLNIGGFLNSWTKSFDILGTSVKSCNSFYISGPIRKFMKTFKQRSFLLRLDFMNVDFFSCGSFTMMPLTLWSLGSSLCHRNFGNVNQLEGMRSSVVNHLDARSTGLYSEVTYLHFVVSVLWSVSCMRLATKTWSLLASLLMYPRTIFKSVQKYSCRLSISSSFLRKSIVCTATTAAFNSNLGIVVISVGATMALAITKEQWICWVNCSETCAFSISWSTSFTEMMKLVTLNFLKGWWKITRQHLYSCQILKIREPGVPLWQQVILQWLMPITFVLTHLL